MHRKAEVLGVSALNFRLFLFLEVLLPWIGDTQYKYTPGILKAIASYYWSLYSGGLVINPWKAELTNDWVIAEYKADFDVALNAIGRGYWTGTKHIQKARDLRAFGRLQRAVIADICQLPDSQLVQTGCYQITQMRGRAYSWMANYLNGLPLWGSYKGREHC